MRLVDPNSGQLDLIHHYLLKESQGEDELFLSAQNWFLKLYVNRVQKF